MARLCRNWGNKDDIRLTTLDANPRLDFFNRPGKADQVSQDFSLVIDSPVVRFTAAVYRGGDRQADAALYRIVVAGLRHDCRTKAYLRRSAGEGMSKTKVIRCLKRYVAREVFSVLQDSAKVVRSAA